MPDKPAAKKPFWQTFIAVTEDATPAEAAVADIAAYEPVVDVVPATVATAPKATRTAMDWTLDDILTAGGAEQGRNSAETVIKMRDSLAAFPPDQQLAMVRGMDVADDTWDEAHVVLDAQKRVAILDKYVGLVKADEDKQIAQIDAEFQAAKAGNQSQINDLDAQIAALQGQRASLVRDTEVAEAASADKALAVKSRAESVRQTVATATARYKTLRGFFGK